MFCCSGRSGTLAIVIVPLTYQPHSSARRMSNDGTKALDDHVILDGDIDIAPVNVRIAHMAEPMPFYVSPWADFSLELLSPQMI